MHTIEIKFLNCMSQKITPRLQNVFVYYKMYFVPSPHKDFLLNSFPPANKVISVHTIEIKFLNCISQKITPKLQNVFVYYKMYSVPSPHKDFLLNNFYIIISREKLRGGGGGVY